jgi:hypothetical protein
MSLGLDCAGVYFLYEVDVECREAAPGSMERDFRRCCDQRIRLRVCRAMAWIGEDSFAQRGVERAGRGDCRRM